MAPPVGRAPTNRSIDRASSPTPRVRRIDPRLVRDHVREFVCLSRAFARRLDRSPLRRPSLPRLRRRRRRILPRFPGRSGRRPSSPARRFGKAPLRKCRCASSRPSHPRVASPRRRVASRRVAVSRHPSQPSPARGGRAVDGSKWMIKKIHVFRWVMIRPPVPSRARERGTAVFARVGAKTAPSSIHPSGGAATRRDARHRHRARVETRRAMRLDASVRTGGRRRAAARVVVVVVGPVRRVESRCARAREHATARSRAHPSRSGHRPRCPTRGVSRPRAYRNQGVSRPRCSHILFKKARSTFLFFYFLYFFLCVGRVWASRLVVDRARASSRLVSFRFGGIIIFCFFFVASSASASASASSRRHNTSHHRARGASIRIRAHTWASRRRRRRRRRRTTSTRGGRGRRM